MHAMRDDLLTVRQAADEKGVSMQAIYKRIHAGDFTTDRIGSLYVIVRDERFTSYQPQTTSTTSDSDDSSNT